jgi:hypothetical protein
MTTTAAIREREARRDAELIAEDRELVRATVAVGVFANLQTIAALTGGLQVVRIIDRLRDPQPTALVPREPDRLDDVRLGREEAHVEVRQRDEMLHRLGGIERLLHRADRFVLRAPCGVRCVVRQLAPGASTYSNGFSPARGFICIGEFSEAH